MLEFQKYSEPTARKEYKCSLCDEAIHEGEKYVRFCGKYDGLMFDQKLHLTCNQMISEYCRACDDNEYTEDQVLEWVQETVCAECEHSWYGDGKDDCEISTFRCQKVIARFSEHKEGADNG